MELKTVTVLKRHSHFFKKHNLEYALQDFKTQKVSCNDVSSWLKQVDMKTLFNSRSTTYKTLKLKELNLDEKTQKEWLCKENLLVKRPVLEFNGKVIVGFNEDIYKGLFL